MTELTLTRSSDDRRHYELPGYGSIRRAAWLSRDAEITTGDGVTRRTKQSATGKRATLAEGAESAENVVAAYQRTSWTKHDGTVTWRGLPYAITTESHWRRRYLLSRDGGACVRVTCRGWGKKPATVEVLDPVTDPALVLFTTWLAQTFVEMDSSSAAGA